MAADERLDSNEILGIDERINKAHEVSRKICRLEFISWKTFWKSFVVVGPLLLGVVISTLAWGNNVNKKVAAIEMQTKNFIYAAEERTDLMKSNVAKSDTILLNQARIWKALTANKLPLP